MDGVGYVAHASALLAMIGSFFILGTYALFPGLRHQGRKLLCFLSAMDLVMAITMLVPAKYCQLQGLLGAFSACSSFFWSCGISLYVYVMLFFSKRVARKFCNWLHLVAWGYPAAWSVYMIANKTAFEPTSQSWCFIAMDQPAGPEGFVLRLLVVWIPIWVCVFISLVVNVVIWRRLFTSRRDHSKTNGNLSVQTNTNGHTTHSNLQSKGTLGALLAHERPGLPDPMVFPADRTLRDLEEEEEGQQGVIYDDHKLETNPFDLGVDREENKNVGSSAESELETSRSALFKQGTGFGGPHGALLRLMFVPVVFVILRAPGTVNRFYGITHGGASPSIVTDYLQALGDPAQGLVNALFFYYTSDKIRNKYVKCICSWWMCLVTACQILRSDNPDDRYHDQYHDLPGSEATQNSHRSAARHPAQKNTELEKPSSRYESAEKLCTEEPPSPGGAHSGGHAHTPDYDTTRGRGGSGGGESPELHGQTYIPHTHSFIHDPMGDPEVDEHPEQHPPHVYAPSPQPAAGRRDKMVKNSKT